ncbi:MAG: nucleotide exchange factor GrpE [Dehalococcoidia bacterium]
MIGDERGLTSEEAPSAAEGQGGIEAEQVAPEPDDVASLRKALAEEKARAESHLANWQRAQADFINLRRRHEQERDEVTRFANATLLLSLLPVVDDLERALASVSPKLAGMTWVDGIRLIYRKLQATLETQGLSEIKAVGEPFDPHIHEATMYGEGEEGIVVEELQKGYKLHDRVIRPTMVVVGKGREGTEQANKDSAEPCQDKGE